MWHLLRRHPLPMQAFFRHSLVLTYALPRRVLEPLLTPGLELDNYGDFGFLAIAMVQTEGLRPVGAPRILGRDFFLSGYRIFTRFTTREGRHLRGLRILRSDTDSRLMALGGNLLTHYHYQKASVVLKAEAERLDITIRTPRQAADLEVSASLKPAVSLPETSPFPDFETARQFAGPLPFTFDYEPQTHSLVLIKGIRKKWNPMPVEVEVRQNSFLEAEPFKSAGPRLANAFYIADIPYQWEKGRVEPLPREDKEVVQNG